MILLHYSHIFTSWWTKSGKNYNRLRYYLIHEEKHAVYSQHTLLLEELYGLYMFFIKPFFFSCGYSPSNAVINFQITAFFSIISVLKLDTGQSNMQTARVKLEVTKTIPPHYVTAFYSAIWNCGLCL